MRAGPDDLDIDGVVVVSAGGGVAAREVAALSVLFNDSTILPSLQDCHTLPAKSRHIRRQRKLSGMKENSYLLIQVESPTARCL